MVKNDGHFNAKRMTSGDETSFPKRELGQKDV
jgi:hypothetical protein